MVLDTETTTNARIPYDIAYSIFDRNGNIIGQHNYLMAEMFNSPIGIHTLKYDTYSKSKYEGYLEMIKNGSVDMKPFAAIRKEMRSTIDKFNATVVAYNAQFDYDALNNFSDTLICDKFFKDETPVWDLMNIVLNIFVPSKNYQMFCDMNGFFSKNQYGQRRKDGNRSTDAETMFNYLFDTTDFKEAHTALADTEIEGAILLKALSRKKKLYTDFVGKVYTSPIWKEYCKR